ncbi:terminase TerL endonuclease subunit, partial [Vibrio crassostreae]
RTTTNLSKQGLEIEPCGQGFQSMSPPSKEFERWVKLGRVRFDGNPVITWAISNITLEMDAAGNIKPNKAKSANKIDPVIALLMAFRTYMMDYEEGGDISDEVLEIEF